MPANKPHEYSLPDSCLYHFNVVYNKARSRFSITDDTQLSLRVALHVSELLQNLGFKVYSPECDAVSGSSGISEFSRAIDHTKWTVLILTPDFLRCVWKTLWDLPALRHLQRNSASGRGIISLAVDVQKSDIPNVLVSIETYYFSRHFINDVNTWNRFQQRFFSPADRGSADSHVTLTERTKDENQRGYDTGLRDADPVSVLDYQASNLDLSATKSFGSWGYPSLSAPPTEDPHRIADEIKYLKTATNDEKGEMFAYSFCSDTNWEISEELPRVSNTLISRDVSPGRFDHLLQSVNNRVSTRIRLNERLKQKTEGDRRHRDNDKSSDFGQTISDNKYGGRNLGETESLPCSFSSNSPFDRGRSRTKVAREISSRNPWSLSSSRSKFGITNSYSKPFRSSRRPCSLDGFRVPLHRDRLKFSTTSSYSVPFPKPGDKARSHSCQDLSRHSYRSSSDLNNKHLPVNGHSSAIFDYDPNKQNYDRCISISRNTTLLRRRNYISTDDLFFNTDELSTSGEIIEQNAKRRAVSDYLDGAILDLPPTRSASFTYTQPNISTQKIVSDPHHIETKADSALRCPCQISLEEMMLSLSQNSHEQYHGNNTDNIFTNDSYEFRPDDAENILDQSETHARRSRPAASERVSPNELLSSNQTQYRTPHWTHTTVTSSVPHSLSYNPSKYVSFGSQNDRSSNSQTLIPIKIGQTGYGIVPHPRSSSPYDNSDGGSLKRDRIRNADNDSEMYNMDKLQAPRTRGGSRGLSVTLDTPYTVSRERQRVGKHSTVHSHSFSLGGATCDGIERNTDPLSSHITYANSRRLRNVIQRAEMSLRSSRNLNNSVLETGNISDKKLDLSDDVIDEYHNLPVLTATEPKYLPSHGSFIEETQLSGSFGQQREPLIPLFSQMSDCTDAEVARLTALPTSDVRLKQGMERCLSDWRSNLCNIAANEISSPTANREEDDTTEGNLEYSVCTAMENGLIKLKEISANSLVVTELGSAGQKKELEFDSTGQREEDIRTFKPLSRDKTLNLLTHVESGRSFELYDNSRLSYEDSLGINTGKDKERGVMSPNPGHFESDEPITGIHMDLLRQLNDSGNEVLKNIAVTSSLTRSIEEDIAKSTQTAAFDARETSEESRVFTTAFDLRGATVLGNDKGCSSVNDNTTTLSMSATCSNDVDSRPWVTGSSSFHSPPRGRQFEMNPVMSVSANQTSMKRRDLFSKPPSHCSGLEIQIQVGDRGFHEERKDVRHFSENGSAHMSSDDRKNQSPALANPMKILPLSEGILSVDPRSALPLTEGIISVDSRSALPLTAGIISMDSQIVPIVSNSTESTYVENSIGLLEIVRSNEIVGSHEPTRISSIILHERCSTTSQGPHSPGSLDEVAPPLNTHDAILADLNSTTDMASFDEKVKIAADKPISLTADKKVPMQNEKYTLKIAGFIEAKEANHQDESTINDDNQMSSLGASQDKSIDTEHSLIEITTILTNRGGDVPDESKSELNDHNCWENGNALSPESGFFGLSIVDTRDRCMYSENVTNESTSCESVVLKRDKVSLDFKNGLQISIAVADHRACNPQKDEEDYIFPEAKAQMIFTPQHEETSTDGTVGLVPDSRLPVQTTASLTGTDFPHEQSSLNHVREDINGNSEEPSSSTVTYLSYQIPNPNTIGDTRTEHGMDLIGKNNFNGDVFSRNAEKTHESHQESRPVLEPVTDRNSLPFPSEMKQKTREINMENFIECDIIANLEDKCSDSSSPPAIDPDFCAATRSGEEGFSDEGSGEYEDFRQFSANTASEANALNQTNVLVRQGQNDLGTKQEDQHGTDSNNRSSSPVTLTIEDGISRSQTLVKSEENLIGNGSPTEETVCHYAIHLDNEDLAMRSPCSEGSSTTGDGQYLTTEAIILHTDLNSEKSVPVHTDGMCTSTGKSEDKPVRDSPDGGEKMVVDDIYRHLQSTKPSDSVLALPDITRVMRKMYLPPVHRTYFDYFRFFGRRPLYTILDDKEVDGEENVSRLHGAAGSPDRTEDTQSDDQSLVGEDDQWLVRRSISEPLLPTSSEDFHDEGRGPESAGRTLHRRSLSNAQDYGIEGPRTRGRYRVSRESRGTVNALYRVMCHVMSKPEQFYI